MVPLDQPLTAYVQDQDVDAEPVACIRAFEDHFDYLYRTLRHLGIQSSDVEDVLQESFLVMHRRWPDYDPTRPARPWLFGIALRVASEHRRRAVRQVPKASLDPPDRGWSPHDALVAKESQATVLSALERIPLSRRAVLVLHDIDQVAMTEIASTLAIPRFTAYSRLRKARKEFAAAVRHLQKKRIIVR